MPCGVVNDDGGSTTWSRMDCCCPSCPQLRSRRQPLNAQSVVVRIGKDFQVGHSFFTPNESLKTKDSKKWFREVVESEIAPLLQEYWFDSLDEADKAIEKLSAFKFAVNNKELITINKNFFISFYIQQN